MKIIGNTAGGYLIDMSYKELSNILSTEGAGGKVIDEASFAPGTELDHSDIFNKMKAIDTVKSTIKQFRGALRKINTELDGME